MITIKDERWDYCKEPYSLVKNRIDNNLKVAMGYDMKGDDSPNAYIAKQMMLILTKEMHITNKYERVYRGRFVGLLEKLRLIRKRYKVIEEMPQGKNKMMRIKRCNRLTLHDSSKEV